jgi:hypothetical protein
VPKVKPQLLSSVDRLAQKIPQLRQLIKRECMGTTEPDPHRDDGSTSIGEDVGCRSVPDKS